MIIYSVTNLDSVGNPYRVLYNLPGMATNCVFSQKPLSQQLFLLD